MGGARPRLRAGSIGGRAARAWLSGRGRVAARFERSLYVRFPAGWVCVGTPEIGNGPLNVVLDAPRLDLDAEPGDQFAAEAVDLSGAVAWRPPPVPAWSAATLAAGLAGLPAALPADLPEEGLASFLAEPARPGSLAARAAAGPVATLGAWLCGDPGPVPAAVGNLLGLGPGLTPSGDDYLAGCLIALKAVGRHAHADALGRMVTRLAPAATTPISACHLECAAAGEASEALHRAVHAVLAADWDHVGGRLDCWLGVGHSSPWDALAGAAGALRAVVTGAGQEPRAA